MSLRGVNLSDATLSALREAAEKCEPGSVSTTVLLESLLFSMPYQRLDRVLLEAPTLEGPLSLRESPIYPPETLFGVPISYEARRAFRICKFLVEFNAIEIVHPSMLIVSIIAEPTSPVTVSLTEDAAVNHEELLTLVQTELLGGRALDGIDRARREAARSTPFTLVPKSVLQYFRDPILDEIGPAESEHVKRYVQFAASEERRRNKIITAVIVPTLYLELYTSAVLGQREIERAWYGYASPQVGTYLLPLAICLLLPFNLFALAAFLLNLKARRWNGRRRSDNNTLREVSPILLVGSALNVTILCTLTALLLPGGWMDTPTYLAAFSAFLSLAFVALIAANLLMAAALVAIFSSRSAIRVRQRTQKRLPRPEP